MKKLALLLAAVGMVSAVAYAAPELKVTSVGQYIEIDNEYGKDKYTVHFANEVGLAYEDWTFGLLARKAWDVNKDEDSVHSSNHRLQFDAWRAFDGYKLGMRWRAQKDFDRLYLRGAYSQGMFSGWADVWYQFNNVNADDNYEMEIMPIAVTYGPFKIGYFFNNKDFLGDSNNREETEHQIRAYVNYKFENLATYAEFRYSLGREEKSVDVYDAGDYMKLEVGASYPVTENLTVKGYYAYEYGDKTKEAGEGKKRYGETCLGWTYTF